MKICAHTLVKNEDAYLWFAVKSVIDHVDRLMLWDTGSTDDSLRICNYLAGEYPNKVDFRSFQTSSKKEATQLRQKMLEETKEDWVLLVDGDEVWWRDSIESVTTKIRQDGNTLDSIVTPFVNLVGDIFHFQPDSLGKYKIDNKIGFITIRAFSSSILGLSVTNTGPFEGYFNNKGELLQNMDPKRRIYMNKPFLHFTHLERSRKIKNKKHKYETGKRLTLDYFYPEVFFETHPDFVNDVWNKIDLKFRAKSGIITPARTVKRWIR